MKSYGSCSDVWSESTQRLLPEYASPPVGPRRPASTHPWKRHFSLGPPKNGQGRNWQDTNRFVPRKPAKISRNIRVKESREEALGVFLRDELRKCSTEAEREVIRGYLADTGKALEQISP